MQGMPSRSEFADFLQSLANGDRSGWSKFIVEHYPDDDIERIRSEVVRIEIAERSEPDQYRRWAEELMVSN